MSLAFCLDGKDNSEFSSIALNIQTNHLPGPALEHDSQPLQIEIYLFIVQASCSTHWSPGLKAPCFTKIQVVASDKTRKQKDACDTAAAASEPSVTAAARDKGGRLAAVGLSLLWVAFPPGNCHGERDQQHWPAAFRKLGISMEIPQYTTYIQCTYIK
jgi:hypothetical protein